MSSNPEQIGSHPFSIRPLVRYVDERQAVIDIRITVRRSRAASELLSQSGLPLDVLVSVRGPGGYACEHQSELELQGRSGLVRFEVGDPQRWWPSGMGEQTLYDLNIYVLLNDEVLDQWENTIGLTSVRPLMRHLPRSDAAPDSLMGVPLEKQATLLVNGHECAIQSVVPVAPADESLVLPAGSHCLLVLRDHFGPDLLFDAADRAGTLLVQSIPCETGRSVSAAARAQMDRLTGHPSLAGWLVQQEGAVGDRLAHQVQELDPTRSVFRFGSAP